MNCMTIEMMMEFERTLRNEERSKATLEKYHRDLTAFFSFLSTDKLVEKETVIAYKEHLTSTYAPSSVNSMLAAVNGFLAFAGWHSFRVKPLKVQRRVFCSKERELTKAEYLRLLRTAQGNGKRRLYLILETICATGIRVSELPFITVDTVRRGYAEVKCKGKCRTIFLAKKLCRKLEQYLKDQKIRAGAVFVTRSGKSVDRTNIWSDMKKLCGQAQVSKAKVFPHNLRHLFARTYYSVEKDLGRLADLLGHSNVETTRIYTVTTGVEQERQVALLGLIT